MKQTGLQNWPGLRIILSDDRNSLSEPQLKNLFWIKNGYLNFFADSTKGEKAARALLILQQQLPFQEYSADDKWQKILTGAEECFYVDPDRRLIESVFQRRSVHSLLKFFWQKLFGCNWSKEYPQLWPVIPVRQIGSVQIGHSKLWARKLRAEF